MAWNICSAVAGTTFRGPSPTRTGGPEAVGGAAPLPRPLHGDGSTVGLFVTMASISFTEASVGEPPVSPVP
jgi:hypothetical protein